MHCTLMPAFVAFHAVLMMDSFFFEGALYLDCGNKDLVSLTYT